MCVCSAYLFVNGVLAYAYAGFASLRGSALAQRGLALAQHGAALAQHGLALAQRGAALAQRGLALAQRGAAPESLDAAPAQIRGLTQRRAVLAVLSAAAGGRGRRLGG